MESVGDVEGSGGVDKLMGTGENNDSNKKYLQDFFHQYISFFPLHFHFAPTANPDLHGNDNGNQVQQDKKRHIRNGKRQ